jgi:uncharacterized protein YbaP (TraB family)
VSDFNELYESAPMQSRYGYTVSAPAFAQLMFDAKQGVRLVPWLQTENEHLNLLAFSQEKSLSEKDAIIKTHETLIGAYDQRFVIDERRYETMNSMNATLRRQLVIQRRTKWALAIGAFAVGYAVGR